jgi:hypothetical protein
MTTLKLANIDRPHVAEKDAKRGFYRRGLDSKTHPGIGDGPV